MGMQNTSLEGIKALKLRNIGRREVTGGADHVVKFFGILPIIGQVFDRDRELAILVIHTPHNRFKADPVAHARLFHTPFNVIKEHSARRIRGDLLAKMLLKGIVGELQAFLGAIGPKIAVHGAVNGLPVLVETGAPRIIPKTAPVGLLLKTDNFRDLFTLGLCRLESSQLRQA